MYFITNAEMTVTAVPASTLTIARKNTSLLLEEEEEGLTPDREFHLSMGCFFSLSLYC
jgi:hypothetical protein